MATEREEFDGWAWWRCRIMETTNWRGAPRWRACIDRRFGRSFEPRYSRSFRTREAAETWGHGKLDVLGAPLLGEVLPYPPPTPEDHP